MSYFNQWMATQRDGMPTWLDIYPVEDKVNHLQVNKRSKHINIAYHNVHNLYAYNIITTTKYMLTKRIIPNGLIKPLLHV